MSRRGLVIRLIIAGFILCVAAVFVYTNFFIWMIRVPTGAMLNTIAPDDCLVVHRLIGNINRGDLVVFRHPDEKEYFIARVIGLPGETIQLKGKLVYINDRALDEQRVFVEPPNDGKELLKELSTEGSGPYRVYYVQHTVSEDELSPDTWGDFGVETPFQIPNDNYFIMGDNRDNSYDSRFRGAVPRHLIWGKPSIIYCSEKTPERVLEKVR